MVRQRGNDVAERADARDGWYVDAGGSFHYGVAGGFAIGRAEVFWRAGARRTEKLDELTPPFYMVFGVVPF